MRVPVSVQNDFTRLIFPCPNCKAKTQFRIVWSPSSAVLTRIHGHVTRYVLSCTACGDQIFIQTREVNENFPSNSTVAVQFPPCGLVPHESIPEKISVDLREAALCLSIGAWNAATVMCRRSLQSYAIDRGADPKEDLFAQLKELKERDLMPEVLYKMAESIRKKGNVGAHPGRDPIVNQVVSEKEAKTVFAIVEHVYKYGYELPSEVEKLGE